MKKYAKRGAIILVAIMMTRAAFMAYSPREFAFEAVVIVVVYGLIGAIIGVILYGIASVIRSAFRGIKKASSHGRGYG